MRSSFLCMTQESPYLTVSEVAARFKVSEETAREWARSGQVEAIRLPGGHYRFPCEAIDAIERTPASVTP